MEAGREGLYIIGATILTAKILTKSVDFVYSSLLDGPLGTPFGYTLFFFKNTYNLAEPEVEDVLILAHTFS